MRRTRGGRRSILPMALVILGCTRPGPADPTGPGTGESAAGSTSDGCERGLCPCEGVCQCPPGAATCDVTCAEACTMDCGGRDECTFRCTGPDCHVRCDNQSTCQVTIDVHGSVECLGPGECTVICNGPCTMACDDGPEACNLACSPDDPGESLMPRECDAITNACDPCP